MLTNARNIVKCDVQERRLTTLLNALSFVKPKTLEPSRGALVPSRESSFAMFSEVQVADLAGGDSLRRYSVCCLRKSLYPQLVYTFFLCVSLPLTFSLFFSFPFFLFLFSFLSLSLAPSVSLFFYISIAFSYLLPSFFCSSSLTHLKIFCLNTRPSDAVPFGYLIQPFFTSQTEKMFFL